KKAELKTLNYTSPRELLAAKFHIAPALLTRLNPKASFETAGTKIVVPNVARKPSHDKVAEVVVDKSALTVRALDANGKLISFYPASVGSESRPSPSGTWHVRSVVENPTYHYSPKLKFKGVKTQKPFDIAAGPMNPVGTTWIGLGDDYGIHGTPDPQSIGKTHRTAASTSPTGTRRRWRRWSTGGPRSSSSTERRRDDQTASAVARRRSRYFIPRNPGCKLGWISLAARRRRDRITARLCCTAYAAS